MTTAPEVSDDLAALLERVRAAQGPDQDLEYDIVGAFYGPHELAMHRDHFITNYNVTNSIDAALALVERKLPDVWYLMSKGKVTEDEPMFAVTLLPAGYDPYGEAEPWGIAEGHSQPLAILAALLTALLELQRHRNGN